MQTPTTDYPGAVAAFKGEACYNLEYSRDRILHCLGQLSEEDLWWRPHPKMNAIGNLVLHVCGNMTQWLIVGCDREHKAEDHRDRPAEFAATGGCTVTELADKLRDTVERAKATIMTLDKDDLLEPRFIQLHEITGFGAIWHSVAHLEGHAQEIIYATRLRLGDRYKFKNQY